jgi:hypothetical protein
LDKRAADSNPNSSRREIEVNAISSNIRWIENLLQTPIDDNRKLAISLIHAPYLLNTRRPLIP